MDDCNRIGSMDMTPTVLILDKARIRTELMLCLIDSIAVKAYERIHDMDP